jgi:hypothetical protein
MTQPTMSALENYANPLLATGVAILNLASVAIKRLHSSAAAVISRRFAGMPRGRRK